MRLRLASTLFVVGAATIATLVFAGERLWFEAHALLLRPALHGEAQAWPPMPDAVIRCDRPDCHAGALFYEVVVGADGRPRAVRFEGGSRDLEPSARAKGAQAALATRWPTSASSQPIRAVQQVSVLPHERFPTRHTPFPDTEGKPVSITLERAGIYNPHGIYSVTLDSDGDIEFCGPGFVKSPGPHQSRISRAAVEALVQEFRKADFFSLDDNYVSYSAESNDNSLRVRIGGQEKTVMDAAGREVGMPAVIRSLQRAVDEAAETSRWVGSPEEWVSNPGAVRCPTGPREKALQALMASRRSAGL